MEVTGDMPQVSAESMYPSGPTELLKFPCCGRRGTKDTGLGQETPKPITHEKKRKNRASVLGRGWIRSFYHGVLHKDLGHLVWLTNGGCL